MKKSLNLKTQLLSLLAVTLVSGYAFANNGKTSVYVELDANAQKSHQQLQALKKMDVLGVNWKKHWAEVAVTDAELAQLQAQHMIIRRAGIRLNKFMGTSDGYLTPEQVVQNLKNINIQYPGITNLILVGKTHEDRSIVAIEISAQLGNQDKPVVMFNAMHHAREVMTTEVAMHIAKVLTENYGKDADVTNWLDHYRIIVVPQVNPDGNALVWNGEPMWRKNAYSQKGTVLGVDLNRNYPAYWAYCNGSSGNAYSETYRGPAAGSEPETKALMNLESTYKPVAEISYHSYSEMILYPFGCSNVKNPAKDLFHSVGKLMNANIRNDQNRTGEYELGSVPDLLYDADGSDIDWLWKEQGVLAFAIEVNASDFHPDYRKWRDVTIERQVGGWQALLKRMAQSGFSAHINTATPDDVTYSIKKIEGMQKLAFDSDAPNRTFKLRSASGLLYQLTEKGRYEITFFVKDQPVKSLTINVGDTLVDLGNIALA